MAVLIFEQQFSPFQLPQESRGGGTVCTSGPILWGNFAHLIDSVQTCN